jgi:signal transduction histidine kinase
VKFDDGRRTVGTLAEQEVGRFFARRVLVRQILAGLAAFATVYLLAPWSLLLESRGLADLWLTGLEVSGGALLLVALWSLGRLREAGQVLRGLAFTPERVAPADVGTLADMPFVLTLRFLVVVAVAAALMVVPGVRPEALDDARAITLALLTLTIGAAGAVVHYVTVRDATIRAIELSPIEPITAWLERESMRLAPRQRVSRKILLAAVAPMAFVGVGSLLVAHAHVRAFVEKSRTQMAVEMAHAAAEPVPGAQVEVGSDDAVAAAAAHGFFVQATHGVAPGETVVVERLPNGQLSATVPLDDGRATVRYSAELGPGVVPSGALLTLLAVLIAAVLGGAFGRVLARDLVLATQQVGLLGTERVLRGETRIARPARFRLVADLGRAVEALTERFREFAAAQERAIDAKAAAQRMKQLLFASVSHDLKSPLNAILGFAELVRSEPLTQAQLESLDMVAGRGRELLALIETILDAARVEAGQMQLLRQPVAVEKLVADALAKARDLQPQHEIDMVVELVPHLPPVWVDPAHAPRALAVLCAHAIDSAVTSATRGRAIRIGCTLPEPSKAQSGMIRLYIEYVAASKRPSLLEAQLQGQLPVSQGRGMFLRLALARAIIELHGGRVDVGRAPHGAAVVTCWLPTADPDVSVREEEVDFDMPTVRLPRRR